MMVSSSVSNSDAEIVNFAATTSDADARTGRREEEEDFACDDVGDLESDGKSRSNFSLRAENDAVVVETPLGCLRGKHQIRAAVQSIALVVLVMGYAVVSVYPSSIGVSSLSSSLDDESSGLRFLEEEEEVRYCDEIKMAGSWWMVVIYIIGILYTFLALAIVCDEFFVPSLEELSGPHRMNLSMDVAGATLMAAGGSAPELATSIIGVFTGSSVGFGTIVGSAVFNILFVIGMCSLLAKEVLSLTWWPLFRDSTYYTVGLVVLAVFTGYVTPGEIKVWESAILFALYIGYILLMWQNRNLYKKITGKTLPDDDEEEEEEDHETHNGTNGDNGGLKRQSSKDSIGSSNKSGMNGSQHSSGPSVPHFLWQGNFRAGILKLLKDPESWADTAGTGMVAKLIGDADYVFEQVDKDGNGHIDGEELKQLFDLLECRATSDELREVFVELDTNGDGVISRKEFTEWYCKSEERILTQVQDVFDKIDVDKSNSIDKDELKTLLATLDPHISDEDVDSALEEMHKHGDPNQITFDEFSVWYKKSMIYERQKQLIEEDIKGVWENISPPQGGFRDWVWYIICLPLVLCMTLTIPDVQRPGNGKWCYVSFFLSIAWIGVFSYAMVDWADRVGNTFGIPAELMGLTILAAGTSVPDLLSSVIVARRGQGDMAVSSSVGSNIFDILVGLPFPWLLYSAVYKGASVTIGASNLLRSLLILIGMLVLVIGAVHFQGWRLTKILGGIMFFLYIAFLAQAIYFALPFEGCVEK